MKAIAALGFLLAAGIASACAGSAAHQGQPLTTPDASATGGAAGFGSGGAAGALGSGGGASDGGNGGGATTVTIDAAPDRSSSGNNGDAATGGDDGGPNLQRCPAVPKCDATPPDPGPARAWRHQAPSGTANHRGRDLFVNPSGPQWVIANFRYGLPLLESALSDEDVDIYLLRGCGGSWEKLGTAATTMTATHPDEEGVGDAPGRLFFQIPADKTLGPGRHRLHLVVAGDLSTADVFIEVVPSGTPLFVSDVDGTLTTSENAQTLALLSGTPPDANANAAQALTLLAQKGYRPVYLTARPEWLAATTETWLAGKGFPPGIVHTTLTSGGASGSAAGTFKTDELKLFAAKGLRPAFAFGNTNTDADAYNNAAIQPLDHRLFFQYTDSAWHGRRIDDYGSLLADLAALPLVCR